MAFWRSNVDEKKEQYIDVREYNKEKYKVRFFKLISAEDVPAIKEAIVEGKTIALVNIGYFKDREGLKQSVHDIKKACATFDGSIAAVAQNMLVITPKNVDLYRNQGMSQSEGGNQHEKPALETHG